MADEAYKGLFFQQGLIDGAWMGAASGKTLDVQNPANQKVIGTVPDMGGAETRAAVEAADRAFGPWKKATLAERAGVNGGVKSGHAAA